MSLKNRIILAAVKMIRPSVSQRGSSRFLIISSTGLGDTLWGTPAIRTLRMAYPHAHITALTSPIGYQVLEHNPHLDQCFSVANPVLPSLPLLYRKLKAQAFTDILLFHTSARPLLPLAAALGASTLIGTSGQHKGLDHLLTHSIPPRFTHEIERRFDLIAPLLPSLSPTQVQMELPLTSADQQMALPLLPTSAPRRIALHPGAKDRFKQWPPELFIRLGQQLAIHPEHQLFITGNREEHPLVQKIASAIPGAIPVTHLPLRPFAAFLSHMNLFITNDTGPMHVAFTMHTPTVALFTATDPRLCGPYPPSPLTHVIAKRPTCVPCIRKKCAEPFCLMQINPNEVYHAALQQLNSSDCHHHLKLER